MQDAEGNEITREVHYYSEAGTLLWIEDATRVPQREDRPVHDGKRHTILHIDTGIHKSHIDVLCRECHLQTPQEVHQLPLGA